MPLAILPARLLALTSINFLYNQLSSSIQLPPIQPRNLQSAILRTVSTADGG